MRPNNRQRSRGGRSGGGGGNHIHKQHHNHNPNRPPNRNQIFDSSGPDVRVRGNAHQVFDKYQALAREAAASGDRIQAEAYFQYADHYYRVIQSQGGFVHRNQQGWNDGGEDGQQNPQQQQDGQSPPQQQGTGSNAGANGGSGNGEGYAQGDRQNGRPEPQNGRDGQQHADAEPGLGGVAFLQSGRSAPQNQDPAAEDQPEVPEFRPSGRRS